MNPKPQPVVCTLTTKELVERSLEWGDVAPLALSREALPDGARTTFSLDDADAVETLAMGERNCCGTWLRIETARTDVFTMVLTTDNPEGLGLIRSMAGLPG